MSYSCLISTTNMASSTQTMTTSKKRRSRVSWMIECSPYITTYRGSSSKARRGLKRTKSDLNSMFDDIPQGGSPLSVQLLRDLKIESPLFNAPTVSKKAEPSPETGTGDNICTNLLTLLAEEIPGKDDAGVCEFDGDEQPPDSKKRKVGIQSAVKTRQQALGCRRSQRLNQHAVSPN